MRTLALIALMLPLSGCTGPFEAWEAPEWTDRDCDPASPVAEGFRIQAPETVEGEDTAGACFTVFGADYTWQDRPEVRVGDDHIAWFQPPEPGTYTFTAEFPLASDPYCAVIVQAEGNWTSGLVTLDAAPSDEAKICT